MHGLLCTCSPLCLLLAVSVVGVADLSFTSFSFFLSFFPGIGRPLYKKITSVYNKVMREGNFYVCPKVRQKLKKKSALMTHYILKLQTGLHHLPSINPRARKFHSSYLPDEWFLMQDEWKL